MKFENADKYRFVLEPRYYYFGWAKSPLILGRPSVLKALDKARKSLPAGYNFKIWDLQRPRAVQLAMISSFRRRFRNEYPKATPSQIEKMVFTFAAKPLLKVIRPDTHRNGGAVDLTILNPAGEELFMGTDHDDLTPKAATNYFCNIKKPNALAALACKNRKLLINVLTKAGFENYAPEWWHWSYNK